MLPRHSSLLNTQEETLRKIGSKKTGSSSYDESPVFSPHVNNPDGLLLQRFDPSSIPLGVRMKEWIKSLGQNPEISLLHAIESDRCQQLLPECRVETCHAILSHFFNNYGVVVLNKQPRNRIVWFDVPVRNL